MANDNNGMVQIKITDPVLAKKLASMSQDQINALTSGALKLQDWTKKYDQANRDAVVALKNLHKPDWERLRAIEYKKQGITTKR